MAAPHIPGGLINAKTTSSSERVLFAEWPLSWDPDFVVQRWDFVNPTDLETTNNWTVVKDAGASIALVSNGTNGEILFSSTATTDDDGSALLQTQKSIVMASGKAVWIEGMFKLSDATDMDFFFGLSINFATNPENVLTVSEKIGFQKDDGDASILAKSTAASTTTSTDTTIDFSNDTYVKLTLYYDGAGNAKYYVNRTLLATHTTNLPTSTSMGLVAFELSGNTTGTKTMTCDYMQLGRRR